MQKNLVFYQKACIYLQGNIKILLLLCNILRIMQICELLQEIEDSFIKETIIFVWVEAAAHKI